MTHREVLEHAKPVWLAAAARDQRQSPYWRGTTGHSECAATILKKSPHSILYVILDLRFICPVHPPGPHDVIHFNDVHGWDWRILAQNLGENPYTLCNPEKTILGF